jgi:hypothetical protein
MPLLLLLLHAAAAALHTDTMLMGAASASCA